MSAVGVFNLGTKTNSNAEGVKEGVHFKIIEDRNGLKTRVLNFENEELCPRNGIIELEPLFSSRRHHNHVSFRGVMDKELGVYVGIPQHIDPRTGVWVFEKITLEEKETLDLSNPKDAMKWACIKRSHFYTDRRGDVEMNKNFQIGAKVKYKAIDKEREAIKFELDRRSKRDAEDIAEALFGAELEEFALMAGFDPKAMSPKTLWMEVVKFAEKDPKKFLEIYKSPTKMEHSTLKKGLASGAISLILDKGYTYNGLTLGFNEPEVIKFLHDNPSVRMSIESISNKRSVESEISMAPAEPVIKDEKDAEILRLRKELEDAKKRALEATSVAATLQAESHIAETDPELAELIAEAKRLDVRGVHNMKDKDKIRHKIAEKKKQLDN